ncbi:lasso peptide biosynthesis PqqD family chaperone [Streptomyces boninensis]|uniref:lasso peptide biosynthesis PqqD family chaperone n=1 Tax=Streptomyces boninensis TaxID=2039455 RepID=UPI003B215BF5
MSVTLHSDVSLVETGDGAVLLHQRTGRYWQLNRTGAQVLGRLLDGDTQEQAAHALAGRHGADPERAGRDVAALVERLRSARLLGKGTGKGAAKGAAK